MDHDGLHREHMLHLHYSCLENFEHSMIETLVYRCTCLWCMNVHHIKSSS